MCPTKATRMPGDTSERLSTELDLEIGFYSTWLHAISTGIYMISHTTRRFLHFFPALSSLPLPTTSILPALDITRMRSRTRTKKIWPIDQIIRHSPFLAGTLMRVLDASSFFFPSTFDPFLRSSLKDMLHVPQRNLDDGLMCETSKFRSVPNLQFVVPFLPTLPHKQKRSSSSRHARLGLPSLTLHQSIITSLMHF